MLATRIMASLLVRDNQLVKGKQFINDRRIGSIQQTVNIMQKREIDEMVILDVNATKENRLIDYNMINDIVSICFMPLAFGGGVKSPEDVKLLLQNGADKVVIGARWNDFELIEDSAKVAGRQSICISYNYKPEPLELHVKNCKDLENAGAGEIILNCVTNDGIMTGYDIDTIRAVSDNLEIPVIALGGAGTYEHLYQGLRAGAHAVCAGAMWAFTENTPIGAKKYLKDKGVRVRL